MDNSRVRRKYLDLMWEAEKRLEVLNGFINKEISSLYLQTTIESEALQLRKVLELIAYASLVAHKEEYENVRNDISKDWHGSRILRKIEQLNPSFYPVPTNGVKNGKWKKLKGGFLTRKQFETLYDKCGNVLHSKNPFSKVSQRSLAFHKKVPDYVARIEKLLTEHTVKLVGGGDSIYVLVPFFADRPKQVSLLQRLEDNA